MSTNARTLIRYIFPALGGLFVTYLYNVVDGIFVGQGVGSAALGAVNIAVPFITFVVAVTAMFPMGGATVVAIRMGRTGTADVIAVSRGIAVKVLMIFCLPMVFSVEAVWLAPLVTELVTLAAAVVLNRGSKKSRPAPQKRTDRLTTGSVRSEVSVTPNDSH